MSRTPLIVGNWKMNKTVAEAEACIQALLPRVSAAGEVEVGAAPPFTALAAMVDSARGSRVELGVHGVILGHSERRQLFGETDRAVAAKVPAALAAGLAAVLCVGETEEERESGDTDRKLRQQVHDDLAGVDVERLADVVIAYEPIWAIGTGSVATPDQAQEAISFIRALVAARDAEAAAALRVLYGGSVDADNAAELLGMPDIDGALVGGASLDPDKFARIVEAA
jgi:triosephosphate isomerase (TIM)